jgi:hypothetical protein
MFAAMRTSKGDKRWLRRAAALAWAAAVGCVAGGDGPGPARVGEILLESSPATDRAILKETIARVKSAEDQGRLPKEQVRALSQLCTSAMEDDKLSTDEYALLYAALAEISQGVPSP